MISINLIIIIIFIVTALLGYVLGIGRTLKFLTKGIKGMIISIIICAFFGGIIQNSQFVLGVIYQVDTYFENLWYFLGGLYLGTVCYYIVLFLVVQLIRILIVKVICNAEENYKAVGFVGKICGSIFLSGFCFLLLLLSLATLKFFEGSNLTIRVLETLQNSFLTFLYDNNPISF